jgi:hypothetical protein
VAVTLAIEHIEPPTTARAERHRPDARHEGPPRPDHRARGAPPVAPAPVRLAADLVADELPVLLREDLVIT